MELDPNNFATAAALAHLQSSSISGAGIFSKAGVPSTNSVRSPRLYLQQQQQQTQDEHGHTAIDGELCAPPHTRARVRTHALTHTHTISDMCVATSMCVRALFMYV